jgi:hypothetical protein
VRGESLVFLQQGIGAIVCERRNAAGVLRSEPDCGRWQRSLRAICEPRHFYMRSNLNQVLPVEGKRTFNRDAEGRKYGPAEASFPVGSKTYIRW